jgi:hypothetical protein
MELDPYNPARSEQPVNGLARTTTKRRGQSKAHAILGISDDAINPPAAPDAPKAPPASFRSSGGNVAQSERRSGELSRSFSARARGLPIDQDIRNSEKRYNDWAESHNEPQRERRHRTSNEPSLPSSSRNDAPTRVSSSNYPTSQRRASDTATSQRQPASIAQPVRSSTVRQPKDPISPTSPTAGEWSHRSPLQKLEGTLNDISKEEKRARVQEAEMLLRESQAGRSSRREPREVLAAQGSGQTPERRTSRRVPTSEPTRIEDPNVTRSSSTRQRENLPPTSTSEFRETETKRLPADRPRHSEYREHQRASKRAEPTARSRQDDRRRYHTENEAFEPESDDRARPTRAATTREAPTTEMTVLQKTQTRPVSYQPQKANQEDQSPLTRSDQHRESQIGRHTSKRGQDHSDPTTYSPDIGQDRVSAPVHEDIAVRRTQVPDYLENRTSGLLHESNSSHKAALAEAAVIGAGTAAAVARSNSRKLQKAPPKDLGPPVTNNRRRWSPEEREQYDNAVPAPKPDVENEKYYLDHSPPQAQLAVQKMRQPQTTNRQVPLGGSEDVVQSPAQHKHHLSDTFHHKPRQQSVSFREPSSTIRKLDEWRNGGVVRLSEADFDLRAPSKDKAWWEGGGSGRRKSSAKTADRNRALDTLEGRIEHNEGPVKSFDPPLYLQCGPLLRYTGLRKEKIAKSNPRAPTERETWRGSVMIVTKDSQSSYSIPPTLRLFAQPMDLIPPPPAHIDDENGEKLAPEHVDPIAGLTKMSRAGRTLYVKPVENLEEERDVSRIETDDGLFEESPSFVDGEGGPFLSNSKNRLSAVDGETAGKFREISGVRLYADPSRNVTFWRFSLEVELGDTQRRIAYSINRGPAIGFWVPARGQSMNIMFYSCNGFSLSVDPNNFSGPDPLWRDVLNTHQSRPFHVMIGGGDQIYNDAVSRQTTIFQDWLAIKNPHDKHSYPFSPEVKNELESFYLERYCMWFSQGLFGMANSQIPMINIW